MYLILTATDFDLRPSIKAHGFAVVIDLRGSTWKTVKPTLRALQVVQQYVIKIL